MSANGTQESAGEHAREAVTQWGRAIRLGAIAMSPAVRGPGKVVEAAKSALPDEPPDLPKPKARSLLRPGVADGGGVADAGLSKLGAKGKAAVALRKGSRAAQKLKPGTSGGLMDRLTPDAGVLDRLTPDGGVLEKLTPDGGLIGALRTNGAGEDHATDFDDAPIPIQESIVVAVPVNVAYDLCTRFEEYPGFVSHVERAEREAGDEVSFATRMRGSSQRLEIEIYDRIENERIDWRSTGGIRHSGVITFHELAPRLTHIELSVDYEPHGLVQRISRSTHLTERMIRAEMRRFKAFAELGEDEGGDPPPLAELEADEAEAAEAASEDAEAAADDAETGAESGGDDDGPDAALDEDEDEYDDEDLEDPEADGDDEALE
ncbi:SRPBCC family protein [Thermoleophilia bacterium SCSIO 60948]|nr:SRPBCC family protein [Thermoleophilia bacterium SCSIO 60948]